MQERDRSEVHATQCEKKPHQRRGGGKAKRTQLGAWGGESGWEGLLEHRLFLSLDFLGRNGSGGGQRLG